MQQIQISDEPLYYIGTYLGFVEKCPWQFLQTQLKHHILTYVFLKYL